jgi:ElaB/YqjD/DUF883 family membrane-anchored ribosome-binding protein
MAQLDTTADAVRGRTQSMVSDAKQTGKEAATAFSDVADTFGDALEDSIRRRPYATLTIVAGIGFLFGAAWAR